MDLWGFKWRRKLGYTQVEAGEKLGLSRGAVQYWESEHRPVPVPHTSAFPIMSSEQIVCRLHVHADVKLAGPVPSPTQ